MRSRRGKFPSLGFSRPAFLPRTPRGMRRSAKGCARWATWGSSAAPSSSRSRATRGPIPDEALLKYDAAVQSGLFSAFSVVTPAYFSQKQVDPWIVAQVDGAELYAVIAQWDDAEELGR